VCADTRRLLDDLGRWLQLESPLTEDYRLFPQTGVAGTGDSSPAIATGHVIHPAEDRHPDTALDPALLQQAEQAYQACRQLLVANAINAINA
jgi:hypothetical protein